MLIRLRTRLGRRRTGAVVLWAVAAVLLTAVVGHAPADAAGGHGGADGGASATAMLAPDAGDHHDGHAHDLGCSIGDALCAVGIALAILLLRRLGSRPDGRTWPCRTAHVHRRAARPPAVAHLRPLAAISTVRLQI